MNNEINGLTHLKGNRFGGNILWTRVWNPIDERFEKELTFLGAILEGIAFVAVIVVVIVGWIILN